jgi:hypothetical protein
VCVEGWIVPVQKQLVVPNGFYFLNIFQKLLTFSVNQLTVRHSRPEVFGVKRGSNKKRVALDIAAHLAGIQSFYTRCLFRASTKKSKKIHGHARLTSVRFLQYYW